MVCLSYRCQGTENALFGVRYIPISKHRNIFIQLLKVWKILNLFPSNILTYYNIPQDISATINGYIENQWLILINLTYATVCQILEIIGF